MRGLEHGAPPGGVAVVVINKASTEFLKDAARPLAGCRFPMRAILFVRYPTLHGAMNPGLQKSNFGFAVEGLQRGVQ